MPSPLCRFHTFFRGGNTMLPAFDLRSQIAAASSASGIGLGGTLCVHLIKTPFTPADNITFVDADEADFGGYQGKDEVNTAITPNLDPATGEFIQQVPTPAGGWKWTCTSTTGTMPQTIYGVAVTTGDHTTGLTAATPEMTMLLPEPITISTPGQFIEIENVQLRFLAGGMN